MEYKSGKTYNAAKFPKVLLVAFEMGFSAIPGVKAKPINKWVEFKKVLRQLGSSGASDMYETIVIDTVDIAYDLCEKYICGREGVDALSDIEWGKGYKMVRDEFFDTLRQITIMKYGLVMISHSVDREIKNEGEEPYVKTFSSLNNRAKEIVFGMSDIVGFSRTAKNAETGEEKMYLALRGTTRFEAGSRFKDVPPFIEFTYDNLVEVLNDAIDKIEEETGIKASETFETGYKEIELNYDDIMDSIKLAHKQLVDEGVEVGEIVQIVEEHLGKGRKVSQATRDQSESLVVILDDMNEKLESVAKPEETKKEKPTKKTTTKKEEVKEEAEETKVEDK